MISDYFIWEAEGCNGEQLMLVVKIAEIQEVVFYKAQYIIKTNRGMCGELHITPNIEKDIFIRFKKWLTSHNSSVE